MKGNISDAANLAKTRTVVLEATPQELLIFAVTVAQVIDERTEHMRGENEDATGRIERAAAIGVGEALDVLVQAEAIAPSFQRPKHSDVDAEAPDAGSD